MASAEQIEREKEARRLRELFKGRFSDAEARQILREKGSLEEAVDFVLSGNAQEVRQFINARNKDLVRELQRDGENVHQALVHGIDTTFRLFACAPCDRSWWRKVPTRKEVSKCKRCRVRYDPVPKEQEWGHAEFECRCGNTFFGSGWLGTQSPCYSCQGLASPIRILPPTRPRTQRKNTPHSCRAANCYNRTVVYDPFGHQDGGGGGGGRGRGGGRGGRARGQGTYSAAVDSGLPPRARGAVGVRRGRGRMRGRGEVGEGRGYIGSRRGGNVGEIGEGRAGNVGEIGRRRSGDVGEIGDGIRGLTIGDGRGDSQGERGDDLVGAVGGDRSGGGVGLPAAGMRGRDRQYRGRDGAGARDRDLLALGGAGPGLDEDLDIGQDHHDDFTVHHDGHSHQDGDVCSHPRSQRTKNVLYPSLRHASTGSTVPTFLSQGEIQEQYDDIMSMPSIMEGDEGSD